MELVNQWVPPGGHTHKDFFQRQMAYQVALWQRFPKFRNIWSARVCDCMSEDCMGVACCFDWLALCCSRRCLWKCCTCGGPDHGVSGLQPRPEQTGAEELSVPKLSLALSHQCPQGVCGAKGAKNRGK